jgi:predicted nucleic-acid-binding Zn-ribbon protein
MIGARVRWRLSEREAMPDIDGKLSADDIAQINLHLSLKRPTGGYPCPYCASLNWVLGQHIVTDSTGSGYSMMSQERAAWKVPYVVYFCTNCGYSMRFNAVMIGLYTPKAHPSPVYPPQTVVGGPNG